MLGSASTLPFSVSTLLPAPFRNRSVLLERAICRLLSPADLSRRFHRAQRHNAGLQFARTLLNDLEIHVNAPSPDLARIPSTGAAIIVANHPYGFAEGLILSALLDSIRPDYKLVGNSLLSGVASLRSHLILVNPFENEAAMNENRAPVRQTLDWLAEGGALVMFPAGEVSHRNWRDGSTCDPVWKTTAARLALRAGCPVVPVYFSGSNRARFHLAGALHPTLRTALIPREFHGLRRKTIALQVGRPITEGDLRRYAEPERASEFLRARTYFLAHALETPRRPAPRPAHSQPVASGRSSESLAREVAALPPGREFAASGEFSVFLADSREIPRIVDEIGRLREMTFREAGEGTGRERDTDSFDRYYQHLFLWSRGQNRIAGAYRLALTAQVLPERGPEGLYTSTLFRYDPELFERIGPAIELGRSFVCREFQKSYSPLLLLWKGILHFVSRNPEAAVLFGAVSISHEYREASRTLIASYLLRRASHPAARLVQARNQKPIPNPDPWISRLAGLARGIQDVSAAIADIGTDAKEVPPLVRHYLNVGGRLLGLAADPAFSDCLDALMLADVRSAPPSMLRRCMGQSDAKAFLEYHANRGSRAAV
jgi:putative hemolysin